MRMVRLSAALIFVMAFLASGCARTEWVATERAKVSSEQAKAECRFEAEKTAPMMNMSKDALESAFIQSDVYKACMNAKGFIPWGTEGVLGEASPLEKKRQSPGLGEVQKRDIGVALVIAEQYASFDAVELVDGLSIKDGSSLTNAPKSTRLVGNKTYRGQQVYCGIGYMEGGTPRQICLTVIGGKLMDFLGAPIVVGGGTTAIRHVDWVPENQANSRKTLTYTGRVAGGIQLRYAEFAGALDKPSITQDVVFDITTDKTIGYGSARLEVQKATNTEITYRLLSGF